MENENIRKELVVSAIENGTVIDHIPAKSVFRVVKMLNLEDNQTQVTIGFNLDSRKYGKKGIIKVSNMFFEKRDINKIALIAPKATLIVIKNYKVVEKLNVEIPDIIRKFVKCVNPNCITNHQQVSTQFDVIDKDELKLQCHYCEKITAKNNIEIL
ncbi:MAG: aspartate carbamoyltransferase regulatory subunit [Lentimicrobiaceae bacterium]|nr:aspartate carbamoyltransferase regulatory subunit [Lentimicrobiaceae bacterium]MCB9024543.1 aspartate carbamoyltransferase regulatory subunit [Lentimicrobiaceae bacterium]MCO5266343.1 aspartate carbamoyltransferase regulatory subunit [Lentimicrobium sp.]HPG33985.1 aspartate carbamoyltransferase regulatory subunit [Lentimicrobium sp.]